MRVVHSLIKSKLISGINKSDVQSKILVSVAPELGFPYWPFHMKTNITYFESSAEIFPLGAIPECDRVQKCCLCPLEMLWFSYCIVCFTLDFVIFGQGPKLWSNAIIRNTIQRLQNITWLYFSTELLCALIYCNPNWSACRGQMMFYRYDFFNFRPHYSATKLYAQWYVLEILLVAVFLGLR